MRSGAIIIVLSALVTGTASGAEFVMPVSGTLYLSPAGGTGGATSVFGLGTSQGNFQPLLWNLPQSSGRDEVNAGFFGANSVVDFGMETSWGNSVYWAFSNDTVSASSRTAFIDLNNSLNMGGSITQNLGTNLWQLHLDDAASYIYDDNDNDLLVNIRVAPVPEPAAIAWLCGAALFRRRRSA